MVNGKIRPKQHIIGDEAVKILQCEIIPKEWIVHEMNPDYGIDLDVELFESVDSQCITLGEHIFMQVKGVEEPKFGKVKINEYAVEVIKHSLEVSEIALVERMGSAFPVLLIVVDISNGKAYQICLNDYIKKVLPIKNPDYHNQKTVTIYIPVKNEITKDNIDILRWYGKRIKLYSMFHEMLSDLEDLKYMPLKERVYKGRKLVDRYTTYDLLKTKNVWDGVNTLRDTLFAMKQNDYILPEAINLLKRITGRHNPWTNAEMESVEGEKIDAYLYGQEYSIEILSSTITNLSGYFETYCREWFLPGFQLGITE